jgi:hypothetical protein
MSRLAVLVVLVACANSTKEAKPQEVPKEGGERIAVPGAKGAGHAAMAGGGGEGAIGEPTGAPSGGTANDPRFHLKPEEGTITVDKGEAKAGAEATAAVKLAPGTGYHVATDYPIKLTLETPAGVKLAKAELTAGGRNKVQGDAQTLSEQALAFAVKATAEKAGAYEIKGVFKFGICEKDSCHPKKQPITITVAAN